jgi:hypothetical protein
VDIIDELRATTKLFTPKEEGDPIVQDILAAVYAEARMVAKKGDSSVSVQVLNQRFGRLSHEQQTLILTQVASSLEKEGFAVKYGYHPHIEVDFSYWGMTVSW